MTCLWREDGKGKRCPSQSDIPDTGDCSRVVPHPQARLRRQHYPRQSEQHLQLSLLDGQARKTPLSISGSVRDAAGTGASHHKQNWPSIVRHIPGTAGHTASSRQKTHRAVGSIVRGCSRTCLPGRARDAPFLLQSLLRMLRFSVVPLHVPLEIALGSFLRTWPRTFGEHSHVAPLLRA